MCVGDHACLLYSNESERRTALLRFVRTGLNNGEKVLYISSDSERLDGLAEEFARAGTDVAAALANGRLQLVAARDRYLARGSFRSDAVIQDLRREIEDTRAEGFPHLRIAGEMEWALSSGTDVAELIAYEEQVDELLHETGTAAICQYDRRRFDAATRQATERVHHLVLAERNRDGGAPCDLLVERGANGDTVLRGEADGMSCESLERSLHATVARSPHVRLDLSDLSFVSAAALRTIRNVSRVLDARGGSLTLVSPRPVVRHVVTLMGFSGHIAIEDGAASR